MAAKVTKEAPRIEDYLLIGDLHTTALVSNTGSIDWMCLPHFDSPSIFSALLDQENGGAFSIRAAEYNVKASYVKDTAIAELMFTSNDHEFRVHDYMVPSEHPQSNPHFLVRNFKGIKGTKEITVSIEPKANYARQCLRLHSDENVLSAPIEDHTLWFHLPEETSVQRHEECGADVTFELAEGETATIVMEYSRLEEPKVHTIDPEKLVREYWRDWVEKGRFFEFCRDGLVRSAITLKLMQYYPTGAIVAAPTTSLPECIGGERNWDYRYTWIRDATFSLYALSILGYTEEAERFFHFFESVAEESEDFVDSRTDIKILLFYTILGQQPQYEEHLEHLSGYKNSKPVRVGNDAADQFQLDIYGSMIDAYYFMHKTGVPISNKGKKVLVHLVDKIRHEWMHKDNGIWEVRADTQHYTYGKVLAWVGMNRALRLADELGISNETRAEWKRVEEDIKQWIWDNCYDEERKTFVQHPNTSAQDASTLLFVPLQFLDRHDERSKEIIMNTYENLSHDSVYVYRYKNPDGLKDDEGAFILCSQWLIASLAAVGEHDKAREIFEELDRRMGGTGLFPEEMDEESHGFLGNYPQAFSHLGYILSAYYLDRYK